MISYRDMTFCDSACVNRDCPRNPAHVPDDTGGLPVSWTNLSYNCEDYQELPELMDEIGADSLLGVWD